MDTAQYQTMRKMGTKAGKSEGMARPLNEVIGGKRVFSIRVATNIWDHLREMDGQSNSQPETLSPS